MTAKKMDPNLLNEFGYCIKSKDWTVQWQNQQCKNVCGDKKGIRCGKNCEAWSFAKKTQFEKGATVFRDRALVDGGEHFDVVVCQNEEEVLSILCPSEHRTVNRNALYEQAQLSAREREVMSLRDAGLSRKEICERLFISLATLKTHLQRIRMKMK